MRSDLDSLCLRRGVSPKPLASYFSAADSLRRHKKRDLGRAIQESNTRKVKGLASSRLDAGIPAGFVLEQLPATRVAVQLTQHSGLLLCIVLCLAEVRRIIKSSGPVRNVRLGSGCLWKAGCVERKWALKGWTVIKKDPRNGGVSSLAVNSAK